MFDSFEAGRQILGSGCRVVMSVDGLRLGGQVDEAVDVLASVVAEMARGFVIQRKKNCAKIRILKSTMNAEMENRTVNLMMDRVQS